MTNTSYDTIEHDYMHIKDYFNNYKFGYIERLSKQIFLQSLNTPKLECDKSMELSLSDILAKSKEQLKQVKENIVEAQNCISELSTSYTEEKKKYEELEEENKRLETELIKLRKKKEDNEKKCNDIRTIMNLISISEAKQEEISKWIAELEMKKESITIFNISALREEVDKLKEIRDNLTIRQRRWSRINLDTYLEDMHIWYQSNIELLQKIFGCQIEDIKNIPDGFEMKLKNNSLQCNISIINGKFKNTKNKGNKFENEDWFKELVSYCELLNESRLFILKLMGK
ncbi:hypothetical protein TCON_1640 [Astathelohania contejeani]|uniref:Uncharacterized protein n=1 Tax=Astathelohania contejeani TaxID=164912 RepID=A0ABQ7HYG3_9MICR|nr:hypothetical protein TCON_1640 [Thelohania contejeani]